MKKTGCTLNVFFEDPFWIGVFERVEDNRLSVCKITFGAEPKDGEVWDYVLKNFYRLSFSPPVDTVIKKTSLNPKRAQREAHKQTRQNGIGTKSQQALQLQREENKKIHKTISKEQRNAEKERRFALRQQKKKEKHRGK